MKSLELKQMEDLQGGSAFYIGLTCGFTVVAFIGITAATAGIGAPIGAFIGAIGCGASIGDSIATNFLNK